MTWEDVWVNSNCGVGIKVEVNSKSALVTAVDWTYSSGESGAIIREIATSSDAASRATWVADGADTNSCGVENLINEEEATIDDV